jgi:murein DD-endopeptidase MepM/ murein hydrolase activator NlpD
VIKKVLIPILLSILAGCATVQVNHTPIIEINDPITVETVTPALTIQDSTELEFQNDVNNLFTKSSYVIDTTGWCTKKINGVWFDYKSMEDSVRVLLNDSLNGIFFTFPCKTYITSPFGSRRSFWHYGIDLKVRVGDTIQCALDGIVRVIQNDRRGYGKVVVVRHHNGLETIYGHLSKVMVTPNQVLTSGQCVGLGGNTGRSTGSHLHFEMRYCGEPFDPSVVIDFTNYTLASDTLILSKANFAYLKEARSTICHTIRKGETLGHIAMRYGTSVRKICSLNGISTKTVLRIGRRIVVRKTYEPEQMLTEPTVQPEPPVEITSENDITASL